MIINLKTLLHKIVQVLLPPKWEPVSVSKAKSDAEEELEIGGSGGKKKKGKKATRDSTPTASMNIELSDGECEAVVAAANATANDATNRDTKKNKKDKKHKKHKNKNIFSKAPAVLVSLTDSIKPKSHGNYMEADDPTHIENIRRSLIEQEFPHSDLSHMSQAYIKSTIAANEGGEEMNRTISEEERQTRQASRILDQNLTVGYGSTGSSAVPSSSAATSESEEHIRHRFNTQSRKYKKRHLDHSEFTSEEDLPYQGDSDLSLPLEILFRVALYINQAKAANKIESTLVSVTTNSIDILVNSLTAFERIVHTPIPKAYSIHL